MKIERCWKVCRIAGNHGTSAVKDNPLALSYHAGRKTTARIGLIMVFKSKVCAVKFARQMKSMQLVSDRYILYECRAALQKVNRILSGLCFFLDRQDTLKALTDFWSKEGQKSIRTLSGIGSIPVVPAPGGTWGTKKLMVIGRTEEI